MPRVEAKQSQKKKNYSPYQQVMSRQFLGKSDLVSVVVALEYRWPISLLIAFIDKHNIIWYGIPH